MTKRLFIALPLSEKTQSEALAWEKNFSSLPVRWLAGKNLHITLAAPWEEAEENIPAVIEKLKNFKDHLDRKTFPQMSEVNFSKITFGPTALAPRLIWAEGEAPAELIDLKKSLGKALNQPDNRPLRLHLTLARFRPEEFNTFPLKNLEEEIDWAETFSSFVLLESRLLPEGADYQVLASFSF